MKDVVLTIRANGGFLSVIRTFNPDYKDTDDAINYHVELTVPDFEPTIVVYSAGCVYDALMSCNVYLVHNRESVRFIDCKPLQDMANAIDLSWYD
jgi:hypothetical protein